MSYQSAIYNQSEFVRFETYNWTHTLNSNNTAVINDLFVNYIVSLLSISALNLSGVKLNHSQVHNWQK